MKDPNAVPAKNDFQLKKQATKKALPFGRALVASPEGDQKTSRKPASGFLRPVRITLIALTMRVLAGPGTSSPRIARSSWGIVTGRPERGLALVISGFFSAVPALIANLDHPNEAVRCWAMHALACDKCKEGSCRPGEDQVIPIAARMLLEDDSRRVRQGAAGLVGESVHRSKAALPALQQAHSHDPSPIVRKIAGWYLPGGPRYKALAPKLPRTKSPKPVQNPTP